MNNTTKPLYMIRFLLDSMRFFDFAKRRGLLNQSCDEGYAIHSLMYELWGEKAPKPFFISGRQSKHITIIGYSTYSKNQYIEHAKAFADPSCYEIIDWQHFSDKQMPSMWATGSTFGFHIKVCPVKRANKSNQYHTNANAERDAYLAYLEERKRLDSSVTPSMTRFEVYKDWLKKQLEKENSISVEKINLDSFQLVNLQRRNQKRKISISKRPDVTLRGEIKVLDSDLFNRLLERGIGRHRSFGFGMLLLHPIKEVPCSSTD
jgi:CRISPR system Cascade subunit CasE